MFRLGVSEAAGVARRENVRSFGAVLDGANGLELLETLDMVGVIVDSGLRIHEASPGAFDLLAAGDGLGATPAGHLVAERPEDEASLAGCVLGVCRGEQGGSVLVHRSAGGRPLVVRIAPMPGLRDRALVCLRPPSALNKHRREILRTAFKLSDAEVGVVLDLADGADLAHIAEKRGSRLTTVRSQVASAMSKTGTRRQAELVALILGLSADGV